MDETLIDGPEPEATTEPPARSAGGRRRLPLVAVVVATVIAGVAAAGAYRALDDEPVRAADGDDSIPTLELTPANEADAESMLAVELTVADTDEPTTLGDNLDGPTVVNFFASWCTPCITEMPDFQSVADSTRGRVHFVGVAVQDRPEDAAGIIASTGVTYDWMRDVNGDLAEAIGIVNMPATMFLDAEGTVLHVQTGALDADELRDAIREHFGMTG